MRSSPGGGCLVHFLSFALGPLHLSKAALLSHVCTRASVFSPSWLLRSGLEYLTKMASVFIYSDSYGISSGESTLILMCSFSVNSRVLCPVAFITQGSGSVSVCQVLGLTQNPVSVKHAPTLPLRLVHTPFSHCFIVLRSALCMM